ncbi:MULTISPECIES: 6-hydroxymethylpterin diphosphokinase MptE-like protein [unclassified Clostridium]|uniref:motility associated factor glycosyltransferase family protein n=1 Tax=unclassified Clostridium TaxID=2614128 RepID=UPI000297BBA2|nr:MULTISPECIES: 6-hydroxymethylpterin diphosphokinase MptE-like protein [unclassified Clostridium]EKQ51131.1 MAG: hypothetical protein A370_05158 [Clostridium sp. Maddingley MBC34-26]
MALEIDISKDGYKILRVEVDGKKKYLGSKYNQKREIDEFIKSLGEISERDNFIIFGLSFGEHIRELLKVINNESEILIIEVNEELIQYCKDDKEIKKIIDNNRVFISRNQEDIRNYFDKNINEGNINFLKVNTYCKYFELFFKDIEKDYVKIKDEISRITLNRNTFIMNGKLYLDNFLSNLKFFAKSCEVNLLENKYKNKPAIIVSAGPSLSKNIEQLKNVDNALILSGGRTLQSLLNIGVNPSCIGIVDPGMVAYKLVEDFIEKIECPLFFNDSTPSIVMEKHKGKKFYSVQNSFIKKAIKKEIPPLYGGGSIAHSLTNLALYMGCNPIIFIGQDLAYTGEQGHDKLAQNTWENLTFDNFYKRNDDIYVKDVFGNPVRTSIQLDTYRKNLEEIINNNNEVKFINATEGGANIKGTITKKLADVLMELQKEKIIDINEYLSDINNTKEISDYLRYTLKECDKFMELCRKGKQAAENCKINRALRKKVEVQKNEKEFGEIHLKIQNSLESIILLNAELSKVIYEVEGSNEFVIMASDSEEEAFEKKIIKINKLYTELSKVIKENYEKIKEIIIDLET